MSTRLTLLALAMLGVACGGGGGGGNPAGPSPPAQGGAGGSGNQSCRQLPSAYTTTGDGYNVTASCSFDASTVRVTCTEQYSDASGGASTFVAVAIWPSRGDVVDEIAVLPPVRRGTTTTVTQTAGGNFAQTLTYSYDGQRRLVQEIEVRPEGTFTTTYPAWDGAGRPTTGTRVGPGGTVSLRWTYDEGARSATVTPSPGIGPCTYFHNENGVVTRIVCAGAEASRTTVTSTFSVCR